mgnify:CR=1 FL=1
MNAYRLFVNGQWVDAVSGETYRIVNPANGQTVATAALGDERDAERAADAAHRAFRAWANTPAPQRADVLLRIYEGMLAHAEELANVLRGMLCHVNLIPVNYVPERNYVRTSREDIFEFKRILESKRINTTIRREQGHDIAAACGQLRAQYMESTAR